MSSTFHTVDLFVPTVVVVSLTFTVSCSCPQRETSTGELVTVLVTTDTFFFAAAFVCASAHAFPPGIARTRQRAAAFFTPHREPPFSERRMRKRSESAETLSGRADAAAAAPGR